MQVDAGALTSLLLWQKLPSPKRAYSRRCVIGVSPYLAQVHGQLIATVLAPLCTSMLQDACYCSRVLYVVPCDDHRNCSPSWHGRRHSPPSDPRRNVGSSTFVTTVLQRMMSTLTDTVPAHCHSIEHLCARITNATSHLPSSNCSDPTVPTVTPRGPVRGGQGMPKTGT